MKEGLLKLLLPASAKDLNLSISSSTNGRTSSGGSPDLRPLLGFGVERRTLGGVVGVDVGDDDVVADGAGEGAEAASGV